MSGYYEQRAVLFDAEVGVEIELRGGRESDDMDEAYDITVRLSGPGVPGTEATSRVSQTQWRAFVRAVGRLR